MRTRDFSAAPIQAQATAMFIGATRYRGPRALVHLARVWFPMVRNMRRADGYCWHRVWWEPPLTLGTIAFFRDRDSLLAFARSQHHHGLMRWVCDGTRNATGGWIRLYTADATGYSNGIWRAEQNIMRHIPRFTPMAGEQRGPWVLDPPQART